MIIVVAEIIIIIIIVSLFSFISLQSSYKTNFLNHVHYSCQDDYYHY